jgi:hypothetical protein
MINAIPGRVNGARCWKPWRMLAIISSSACEERAGGRPGCLVLFRVLAPMSVDCAALDTKYLADEVEWNARHVFLAQNPTCAEACSRKDVADAKASFYRRHSMISARAATATSSRSARGRLPISTSENGKGSHWKKVPYDPSRNKSKDHIWPFSGLVLIASHVLWGSRIIGNWTLYEVA